MIDPFAQREIWFLTGSQDLYGPETLEQVATQSQQVAALLDDAEQVPVRIVWKPVLKDAAQIRRTALAANADPNCVGVIAWMHTFSPAKMWITGLDALRTPLLHLHTQADAALPWSTIDMDFMNLNQAAHGDREFGYLTARLGTPRKIVVGHASQDPVRDQVGTWARAATAWAEIYGMSLVRFGDNMRGVAVTEGDKTEAELRLGVSVNTWGVHDLATTMEQVTEQQIDDLIGEYLQAYDVVEELRPGGDRHESLRYGARQEAGIRAFLEDVGAGAFTTNFEDLGPLRQLPGLAVQRLMAAGYGFGAEGDWKTAILVRAAKVMGYGLPGGASLMEDYTYDLSPGNEVILGAHMLEICPTLTTSRPSLQIHPLSIGDREDPVRLVFDTDPGEGLVVALSDLRERFRLVAGEVDIVGEREPMPNLPVAHAVWVPRPDLATSAGAWLTTGGAHHTVLTTAVGREVFEDFAEIAGIELVTIDADTTVAGVRQELRWNAAYYRLAQPMG